MLRHRRALAGVVVAAGLGALVVLLVLSGGSDRSGSWPVRASGPAGSHARFVFLASRRSNQCGLQAAALDRYSGRDRLQGSCCSAMDEHAYRAQVERLRAYRRLAPIPPDPYDIAIPLVRRLLRYDRSISLSRAQRRTYARAMALSEQKGAVLLSLLALERLPRAGQVPDRRPALAAKAARHPHRSARGLRRSGPAALADGDQLAGTSVARPAEPTKSRRRASRR
jgi:hypothetical protein